MKWLKIVLGVASIGLAFWAGNALMQKIMSNPEAEAVAEAMVNEMRPGFALPDLNNQLHNVREWDGQVLVVNFWATWCPPCRKEMPDFIELQKKYGAQGLQFVGIALDEAQKVEDFVNEIGVDYPILLGGMKAEQVSVSYGNRFGALPYTVIVDRNGRIAFAHRGELTRNEAEKVIVSLL